MASLVVLVSVTVSLFGCGIVSACGPPAASDQEPGDELSAEPSATFLSEEVASSDTAAPQSISDTIAFINSQPLPLTVPAFLDALPRPLNVFATSSPFSVQPAMNAASPRVFLFGGELVLAIAIDGRGSHLLELSEFVADSRSVKAEIAFPVEQEIAATAPYERIAHSGGGTVCRVCHAAEEPAPVGFPEPAYVSHALRPPSDLDVPLDELSSFWKDCDSTATPGRCLMLDALFSRGEVMATPFPAQARDF